MEEKSINNICRISGRCSGCQLNNLPYSQQLRLKQSKVNRLFYGLVKPEKIVASPEQFRYRNKAGAVFFEDKNKEIRWGIYQSATGGLCAAGECFLQPEIADEIFNSTAQLIKSFKIKLYNNKDKTGFFRSAMIRMSHSTGQLMLVLVTAEGEFPKERSFVNALLKKHKEITCIVQSIYTGSAVVMTGEKEKILFGNGFIEDVILGKKFRISAHSFYQINSLQTAQLYHEAVSMAEINEGSRFLDAYCGTGTIGIIAAKNGCIGYGVEINSAAVEDAKKNAEINGINNIQFICGDAGDVIEKSDEKYDVVFIDPPRAGCSRKFLSSLVKGAPEKIVYVSCNPETQVRDIRFLLKNGYKIRKAVPFDMFPHTWHVETVVLLVRYISTKEHVTITVKPEELELGSLQTHGTYEEIKKYVLDNYGLKVSTLNISQVKRKCGLDVGDAYNKPKSSDAKQPRCTEEREKAIISALKYYGMI